MSAVTPLEQDGFTNKGLLRYLNIDIPLRNIYDFIELSRNGIDKKSLLHLAKTIGFELKELALILHMSERTLQRYALSKNLGVEASAKVLQLAKLYAKGEAVFGDLPKFKKWMEHPNYALAMKKPKELLDTTFGFQLLNEELVRIEHGIFA
ncbi:type II toxin-antitoxin system Xre/ParS family antitoxin [Aquimarina brevivitae]|uniref:Putative toxin-antitoxin system antitoxin component (TIGR02293 family) n=1 Tax=Aquimarina brevivitae TaxID=323412 RepID=A0A4Q7NYZ0_9FLAO|nr:antitoxin Xre/MbcA/ParS toxin-binding domain-containing protein [Aquimarina brevivitae]RZS92524.1 putative toxin-antitoxin system antitoxin component (TIGR02293 family) [Aquimarina brevivitae]